MANHLVIMAGGIGSRFWPLSTPECPKQFLDITGCGRSMLQMTVDRFKGIIEREQIWVVTAKKYQHFVEEQVVGIRPSHILLEPCMRNTAPCIAYASWKIHQEDEDANIVVAPSDHLVLDTDAFQQVIRRGLEFVKEGSRILTLGMKPTRPETGYGYIEQGEEMEKDIFRLQSFREKPDLPTAVKYLRQGGFTWNSGIFLWNVNTIISELRWYVPQIASVMDCMQQAFFTHEEQSLVDKLFPTCEKISIDYAVMENTSNAYVLPSEFGWSDLGTWGSLYSLTEHDELNNAVIGDNVKLIDAEGCIVQVPDGKQVVIQGIHDCIVAERDNTLLICKLDSEQKIKDWH